MNRMVSQLVILTVVCHFQYPIFTSVEGPVVLLQSFCYSNNDTIL